MREEVRAALDGLVAALEAHADAAAEGTRPDIPDPLPQAIQDLVAAVAEYRRVVEHWTGAHVPLEAPEPASDESSDEEESAPPPLDDDVDWAGDAERWR